MGGSHRPSDFVRQGATLFHSSSSPTYVTPREGLLTALLYSETVGTIFAAFLCFCFIVNNEIEKHQVYGGYRGRSTRKVIFPDRFERTLVIKRLLTFILQSITILMPGSRGASPIDRRGVSPFSPRGGKKNRGISPAALVRGISPFRRQRSHSLDSNHSENSDGSHPGNFQRGRRGKNATGDLPPPVLVYHENARSIVFRDHLRRASSIMSTDSSNDNDKELQDVKDFLTEEKVEPKDEQHQALGDGDKRNVNETNKPANDSTSVDGTKSDDGSKEQDDDDEGNKDTWGQNLSDMANVFFPDNDFHFSDSNIHIAGYQPNIVPLPELELGPNDEYEALLESPVPEKNGGDPIPDWTDAEKEVYQMLKDQMAVVKTIKNSEWTSFLQRFKTGHCARSNKFPDEHDDIAAHDGGFPFNSFVTSTSLLPPGGRKMRSYGAPTVYTTGVVFALPQNHNRARASPSDAEIKETEDDAASRTRTWSWPSGYSAKTEFNIDNRGNLINGRQEALVPLSKLREYNNDYVTKEDYVVAGRVIKGGLKTVPYNEVFVRVGGRGRIVGGKDCATGEERDDAKGTGRSFDKGVGLPAALFIRTNTFGHLISLFRTRARLVHALGERHISGIPLLYISPDLGVRVLTESLQRDILRIAARSLNPFQNSMIAHKTTIDNTDKGFMDTKLEELIDLDESIRRTLTPEECARLAGGFGVTDESIAQILKEAMLQDKKADEEKKQQEGSGQRVDGVEGESHRLQDIVNEGLAAAVRSGDYYTSRQLLILYSLVASEGHKMDVEEQKEQNTSDSSGSTGDDDGKVKPRSGKVLESDAMIVKGTSLTDLSTSVLPPPPPPPPLDTDRLRSATNSDGLLAVLGAAQVLKAMRDGGARKRTHECVLAVEE